MSTLPNTYQQVEYIESTGTQYIDTGLNADSKLQTIIDMQYTNISDFNNTNFGAIKVEPSIIRYHIMVRYSTFSVWLNGTENAFPNISTDLNRHLFNLDVPNGKLALDNNEISFTLETFDTGLNFWLFARNSDSQSAIYYNKSKIYRCKMIYDGTIVRDFVPCYRKSDNTIGLYDLVNDVFYTNNGTGTFRKGNNVTIADKLSYLRETKEQIMERVNNIDGNVTDNTTFRQGMQKVVDAYNYYNNESQTITPTAKITKAEYLKETKRTYKEAINLFDEGITDSVPFREYTEALDDIYNNLPKVEMEGNDFQLQDTKAGKLLLTPKGNIEQEEEPTPDYPQDIKVVTGNNNVIVRGLNLLPYKNTTQTRNGLTFTNHGDGTFTINGTATEQTIYCINAVSESGTVRNMKLESTSYRVNVGQTMSNSTFFVQLAYKKSDGTTAYASVATDGETINNLTIQDINNNAGFGLIIREGTSFDNVLIKPMLQLATTSYNFEEYIEPIEKELDLRNIELAKISDYQDLIFKNEKTNPYYDNTLVENAWYKKGKIGKKIINGNEDWAKSSRTTVNRYYIGSLQNPFIDTINDRDNIDILSNYITCITPKQSDANGIGLAKLNEYGLMANFSLSDTNFDTLQKFKTWLNTHNTTVYYLKDNSIDIQITETALINQLEELNKVIGTGGTVVIETESNSNNAQLIVNAKALVKVGDDNG